MLYLTEDLDFEPVTAHLPINTRIVVKWISKNIEQKSFIIIIRRHTYALT